MRALTLTQPWAEAVASGLKVWETRSWQTSYRGPIAIHAAKGFPKEAREFASAAPLRKPGIVRGYRPGWGSEHGRYGPGGAVRRGKSACRS